MEQVDVIRHKRIQAGQTPKEGEIIVDPTADFLWNFCTKGRTGKNNISIIQGSWKPSKDYLCPGSDITKRTNSRRRNSSLKKQQQQQRQNNINNNKDKEEDDSEEIEIVPAVQLAQVDDHIDKIVGQWDHLMPNQIYMARTTLYKSLHQLKKTNAIDFKKLHDKLTKDNEFQQKIHSLIRKEQDMDANQEQYGSTEHLVQFKKQTSKFEFKSASELMKYSMKWKKKVETRKADRTNRNNRNISTPNAPKQPKYTIDTAHEQIKSNQLKVTETKTKKTKINERYSDSAAIIENNNAHHPNHSNSNQNKAKFSHPSKPES